MNNVKITVAKLFKIIIIQYITTKKHTKMVIWYGKFKYNKFEIRK